MNNFTTRPGLPADPSRIKPIYLVIAEDPESTAKGKLTYYLAKELIEGAFLVEIRGFRLTKEQKVKVEKEPRTEIGKSVNTKIPMHRIVRIDNITYKVNK